MKTTVFVDMDLDNANRTSSRYFYHLCQNEESQVLFPGLKDADVRMKKPSSPGAISIQLLQMLSQTLFQRKNVRPFCRKFPNDKSAH
jgi:hypothetical protein